MFKCGVLLPLSSYKRMVASQFTVHVSTATRMVYSSIYTPWDSSENVTDLIYRWELQAYILGYI